MLEKQLKCGFRTAISPFAKFCNEAEKLLTNGEIPSFVDRLEKTFDKIETTQESYLEVLYKLDKGEEVSITEQTEESYRRMATIRSNIKTFEKQK